MADCTIQCSKDGWSGDPDPRVAHNFAIDLLTGERICAHCGAPKPKGGEASLVAATGLATASSSSSS